MLSTWTSYLTFGGLGKIFGICLSIYPTVRWASTRGKRSNFRRPWELYRHFLEHEEMTQTNKTVNIALLEHPLRMVQEYSTGVLFTFQAINLELSFLQNWMRRT